MPGASLDLDRLEQLLLVASLESRDDAPIPLLLLPHVRRKKIDQLRLIVRTHQCPVREDYRVQVDVQLDGVGEVCVLLVDELAEELICKTRPSART